MSLEPNLKLNLVLAGMAGAVILSALDPFIIQTGVGPVSKEFAQGSFLIVDFLAIVLLWKQFNSLRIILNKKELEDEKLSKLEKEVDRITQPKT